MATDIPSSQAHRYEPCSQQANASPIISRIRDKLDDYDGYEFTELQSGALNIFFDLVQEFDGEPEFHAIVVMVPKIIFNLDCALYLMTSDLDLTCVGCTGNGAVHPFTYKQGAIHVPTSPDIKDGHIYFPIRGNPLHIERLPFTPPNDVIGCLEIFPAERLAPGETLFWEKFANRIGFQMHNRMEHSENTRHLKFIRSLAKDIGHNVIVPNMYFKLYFNHLRRSIDDLHKLQKRMTHTASPYSMELADLHEELESQLNEISRHYQQTSLYLETLLRQSHFEKGHYVLERRTCNVPKQVMAPQLYHYQKRLEEAGIDIAFCQTDIPDELAQLDVDMGLLAQVFANLFSNALKYTDDPEDSNYGHRRLSCSVQAVKDGVRFSIATTGAPIPEDVGQQLFNPGVRGRDAEKVEGTGHGLFFVKQIVELHGGYVWHSPTPDGNEFHFVLPSRKQS